MIQYTHVELERIYRGERDMEKLKECKLVEYIVELGLDVGRNHFGELKNQQEIKKRMREYIERQEKINELIPIAEEVDFEGLSNYLSEGFLGDVERFVFSRTDERKKIKGSILAKANSYSKTDSIQLEERVKKIVEGAIDILYAFYQELLSDSELLQLAEMSEEMHCLKESLINAIDVAKEDVVKKMEVYGGVKQEEENAIVIEDIYATEGEIYYQFTARANERCTVDNMFLSSIYSFYSIDDSLDDARKNEKGFDNKEALFEEVLNIVNQQRVLLIVGYYGSGKTVFLKTLHRVLCGAEDVVVFTSLCQHLMPFIQKGIKEKLYSFFDSLHKEGKKHYILLDGLDDLNFPSGEGESWLEKSISLLMDYIKVRKDYYLIITSRNYIEMGNKSREKIEDNMAYYYFDKLGGKEFQFIKTREFNPEEIGTWIEWYAGIHGTYVDKTTVKTDYKRIMKSLANPLFLYIFMGKYIKKRDGVPDKYYCYYQEFVEQTIIGKYYYEARDGAYVLNKSEFLNQYQELLEYISFDILQHNNDIIELGDEIWQEEILLGERLRNRNYYLWTRQFSEVTEEKMAGMSKSGIKEANLLNCYFIAKEGDFIFFRDVNVLFLLAANRVYKSLWEIIQRKDCVFDAEDMKEMHAISFYPQLLDFVLYQIVTDEREEAFWRYTYDAVSKEAITGKLILIQKENSDVISKILLLYIIFIKLNDKSYKMVELRHLMKDMTHYNKLYKEVKYQKKNTGEYIYSVERYFMGVNLSGATINRLNLKFYNFQGANLSDVIFFQCRFCDNNFKNIKIKKVTFELCSIQELELINEKKENQSILCMKDCQVSQSKMTGIKELKMKGCKLEDVTINISAHDEIELEECNIHVLHLKCEDGSNTGKIKFSNCVFNSQISLKKMRGKIEMCKKCIKNFDGKLFSDYGNVDIDGEEMICE